MAHERASASSQRRPRVQQTRIMHISPHRHRQAAIARAHGSQRVCWVLRCIRRERTPAHDSVTLMCGCSARQDSSTGDRPLGPRSADVKVWALRATPFARWSHSLAGSPRADMGRGTIWGPFLPGVWGGGGRWAFWGDSPQGRGGVGLGSPQTGWHRSSAHLIPSSPLNPRCDGALSVGLRLFERNTSRAALQPLEESACPPLHRSYCFVCLAVPGRPLLSGNALPRGAGQTPKKAVY